MAYSAFLICTIAVLPFAKGIAFGGPAPTETATNLYRVVGAPKPETTKGPSVAELRRRAFGLYPETCGWIDGDSSSALSCAYGRTCMLYTTSGVGMAGCCDGFDTQGCEWANSCVDYDTYTAGGCGADCLLNSFVRKCTDSDFPYCVTWTYPSDNVVDYGCSSFIAGTETVLQALSDDTASISLPTISGNAVTGWDGETSASSDSSDIFSDIFTSTESNSDSAGATGTSSSGVSFSGTKSKKKVSIALIAGAVIGALVLLIAVGAAIIFICIKKKKSKQAAANQQAIAAAQASRPQSAYPPQQPQMQRPAAPMPPPPQTPQPYYDGYFAPQGQQDQKYNPQTQPHEYGLQSPVSNPPTPAPAYVQPYYAAPPMPSLAPSADYPAREPIPGTHEMDSITVPRPPTNHGPVYEMGPGK
ncbi:hypothetical protein K458DRAFT_385401 [Lentithecium fluviatile CBS 122367]|uniref:Mid2 domain-containing protein n=1 Tax=Lentithecium fluviatile CBS 122367 TaxID=1168545 RepID=A0A6G1JC88_9PLEO|nr:hypothetical protein K458DRAFT_385401 [Lentithecium fluviatile CBS 122367]